MRSVSCSLSPGACARRVLLVSVSLLGALGSLCVNAWASSSQITAFSVTPSSQVAGAHGNLSVGLQFATSHYPSPNGEDDNVYAQEAVKKIAVELPPGMLANPTSLPACDDGKVGIEEEEIPGVPVCSDADQVGVLAIQFANPYLQPRLNHVPVYNLTRATGQTARFGAVVESELIHIDVHLRDTSDYGATATIENIPDIFTIVSTELTLWGEPAESSHDTERPSCIPVPEETGCPASLAGSQTFYSNPVTCSGPSQANASAEFYEEPGEVYTASDQIPAFTGCEGLSFSPGLSFGPAAAGVGGSALAGQPSAFSAVLTVPQEASNEPEARASANVQNVSLRLPAGMTLSPSVANGLEACSNEQFGMGSEAAPTCPLGSLVGKVRIHSPFGDEELSGSLFVGSQQSDESASGEMYRLLLYALGDGVSVKLVGHVAAEPATGQLTVTFAQDPQVPFGELALTTKGGADAPLVNPSACGTASTSWSINSWAQPEKPVDGTSDYQLGGACGLSSQFSPSLTAGTEASAAGSFSPLVFDLGRPDGQQEISGIPDVSLPDGVLADVGQVPECPSTQAASGGCSEASRVGSATIGAGAGSAPFYLQDQPVYLTGPTNGAPFGLAVVAHVVAGPFNLGTVVVRQALFVEPSDAKVRVVSEAVPHILGGVPLRIQTISLDIDRPGFTFNATNCTPQALTATVTSVQGARASLSSPYQAGDCAALKFKPRLSATAPATTSKKHGAGLTVDLKASQGPGESAHEANLREVEVRLPKAFSVRLATLKKACVASVFEANPASCPSEADVGTVTAHTPILAQPLTGPAYLVSHGGEAFPDLELVLQADERGGQITIILDGKTRVDTKDGNTLTSDFKTLPDAPISSFQLHLPKGSDSILASPYKTLCNRNLGAPTRLVAQSGRQIEDSTHIAITGCPLPLHAHAGKPKAGILPLYVQVPAAGTLHATGTQITTQTRKASKPTLITLTLELNHNAITTLKTRRQPKATIHLTFTPQNHHNPTTHTTITTNP